jgi:crotonobetainyl-CoA:carnitine CoA-transferase CaiB-like acyl-CoA transferase
MRVTPNPLVGNYVCQDGKTIVLMMLQGERFWPHFAETIGRRDLLERYPTPAARQEKRQEIAEELGRHFATRSRDEWAHILRASECIWAPLQSPLDLPQDPQVEANGYLLESPAPEGTVRVCANPVQFAGEPPTVRRSAQEAGAQTEEVLLELGCSWEEIARWKEAGIIA